MPTRLETSSAACRRGTPAATSSATVARARSSSPDARATPGPSTSVISPFGGSSNRSRELRSRSPHDLLEPLRQLAADGRLSLRIGGRERPQRRGQPLRRLEGDRRPRPAAQLLPQRRQLRLAARQEADEAVLLRDEPGGDERGLDGGRPRQHGHVDARRERRAHKPRPGVGHARQARVGDERHSLAPLEPRQKLSGPPCLVVLVIREEPGLDPVALEQDARVARVLAQHDVGGRELGQHSKGDVLEVPDRRRADRERHQLPSPNETRPEPGTGRVREGHRPEPGSGRVCGGHDASSDDIPVLG